MEICKRRVTQRHLGFDKRVRNTRGGWVILGVSEDREKRPVVEGLKNVADIVQRFYDLIRNPEKISHPVCGADDVQVENVDGLHEVVVIRIRAASRTERPVYIKNNPYRGTYVRRNSGDYRLLEE